MEEGFKQSKPHSSSQKIGIGTAHSKIILMGEHAVVYDYPAIALPFPAAHVKVIITAAQANYSTIESRYYTGELELAPVELENLLKAIELTMAGQKLAYEPIHILIESNIPSGRGMGSSAAVAVAIVRALCAYYSVEMSEKQLHYIVNEAEMIAHEATSGLDTLLTSSNHPFIYRKSQNPRSFAFNLDAHLVVADSGQEGQTKRAIIKVMKVRERKPEFANTAMNAVGDFVNQAVEAIEQHDVAFLGRLMTYNHYYLNQLEISNPLLDKIVNAAWLAGALGAKLTGGGLGGCVIALAENKLAANAIELAMRTAGATQTWQVDLKQL